MSEKYTVHDYTVEQILNFIKSDEIAILEIQRPFVWKGGQVDCVKFSSQFDPEKKHPSCCVKQNLLLKFY